YCVTAPVDSRLPGGGGYQLCEGLGDIKPAKFGLVDSSATLASHFGTRKEVYDGVDVTFQARLGEGRLIQGGMNLGRSATEGVATINLIEPNTKFEDRLNQVDVRLTKIFKLGGVRLQGMVDIYNIFNSAAILGENTRYGSLWLQPIQVVGARLFKLGAQLDF